MVTRENRRRDAEPEFMILYVDSPPASAAFYADLLGQPGRERSPTFALFALPSGLMLGLWSRHTVEPSATVAGGGEVAFTVGSADAVDAAHAEWSGRGLKILQPPTEMDFGRTFVALDPDSHRLRVFSPAERRARHERQLDRRGVSRACAARPAKAASCRSATARPGRSGDPTGRRHRLLLANRGVRRK